MGLPRRRVKQEWNRALFFLTALLIALDMPLELESHFTGP